MKTKIATQMTARKELNKQIYSCPSKAHTKKVQNVLHSDGKEGPFLFSQRTIYL